MLTCCSVANVSSIRFLAQKLMHYNSFDCFTSRYKQYQSTSSMLDNKVAPSHSCGLWVQASYINHSCNNNAMRTFAGDLMIVRASKDIDAGCEVTWDYVDTGGTTYKDIEEKLKPWGFSCTCSICQDGRATPTSVIAQRCSLRQKIKAMFDKKSMGPYIQQIVQLLKSLSDTYKTPAFEAPRTLLWDLQFILAQKYFSQEKWIKSLETTSDALASLGFVVVGINSSPANFTIIKWGMMNGSVPMILSLLQFCFGMIGCKNKVKKAKGYLKVVYKILVGDDSIMPKDF